MPLPPIGTNIRGPELDGRLHGEDVRTAPEYFELF
jgi:hypothetical protein